MIITSLENDRVKKFCKLQKRKYRDEFNQYIVEGEHLVMEAYKAGVIDEIIALEGLNVASFYENVNYYSRDVMKKISSMECPPEIMALCRKKKQCELKGKKYLVLDGIQDPGNLGTIIRSALAFNIETIILTEKTVDLYNSKVLRAAQGMVFHMNIIMMDGLEAVTTLKEKGILIYGTDVESGEDVRALSENEREKFALIMGNEGQGVRRELKDLCTKNLYIRMNEKVESLNVAIATSILLYELGR